MTRDAILEALCAMLPGQFDLVLGKLAVPTEFLSGAPAAQATRAVEAVRYLEQQGGLLDLAQLLRPAPLASSTAPEVAIARLPIPGKYLFGRDGELVRLDACWSDPGTHVVSIVAMGGAGKTALVDAWLKRMQKESWQGAERVFGWSFYSQGSSNTASGDTFIAEALRWFGDTDPTAGSAWDKGARLARLVKQHRTLLVLDGLEPLQARPGADGGKIRDPGVGMLVRELATGGRGLCVISTRLTVADLAPREDGPAPKIDLDQLSPEDGANLLEVLGVRGPKAELEDAAREMKGHALALTLLGRYLADACDGDIRKRKEIGPLESDATQGEHAKRVMAAYASWFGEGPEVAVLRLLGLFDRPADEGCIRALRTAPAIPKLTNPLVGMNDVRWNQTLAKLRRARLVAGASEAELGVIDAHPFVREHFGARLREEAPEAWQEGHGRLFEHLQRSAPELPEDVVAMAPLYAAVVHGCHAGRRQEAFRNVLRRRVDRGNKYYNVHKLGALGAELGMLAAFFDPPWTNVAPELEDLDEGLLLNKAGLVLGTLGRFDEATEPTRLSLEKALAQQSWKNASSATDNLSMLHLARGAVNEATATARQSVELADKSEDWFSRATTRTTLANILHQAGIVNQASALFEEAEAVQRMAQQPKYPLLYGLQGFFYCDLLLDLDQAQDVVQRAHQMFEWRAPSDTLLDIALDHLSLGRARLLLTLRDRTDDFAPAHTEIDKAVTGLRQAGQHDYLSRGLLARAELHLAAGDLSAAAHDLEEAQSIAIRGGMRLHEADTQLGFARLHIARGDHDAARASHAAAKALVERTGYHRRDRDLAEIEEALARAATGSPPPTAS